MMGVALDDPDRQEDPVINIIYVAIPKAGPTPDDGRLVVCDDLGVLFRVLGELSGLPIRADALGQGNSRQLGYADLGMDPETECYWPQLGGQDADLLDVRLPAGSWWIRRTTPVLVGRQG